jgi:3'-5' exoribonuclease
MKKHVNIKDMTLGQSLDGFYLVKSKRSAKTKADKTYLNIDLQDRTGIINAKVWEDAEACDELFQRGDVIKIRADVDEFRGRLQLKLKKLRAVDNSDAEDFSLDDLIPSTEKNPDAMLEYLIERIAEMKNPHLKALLELFFQDEEFLARLKKSAAARNIHHAFRGGLLEHVHSMTRIAMFLSEQIYPDLDQDLILAGTLLHDLGKMDELDSEMEVSYTDEGYLLGHIYLSARMMEEKVKDIPDFPEELRLHLLHIILSHHGEHEWGSPVLPATPEAMLIHHIDNLDAKVNMVKEAIASDRNLDETFTEYHSALQRHLYKGRPKGPSGQGS